MMKKLGFLVASALLLVSGSALADQSKQIGVYIGATGGVSHWDDDNNIPEDWCCMDNEDLAWQINAGYKFNRHFALDGRYNWLGKFNIGSGSVDFEAWSLNGVGILPLGGGSWELFGQLGAGNIDVSSRSYGNAKETMWTLGGGVRYNLNRHLSLSGQLDAYSFSLNRIQEGGSARNYIGTATFGIQYIFE